jgi:hypothetical protein
MEKKRNFLDDTVTFNSSKSTSKLALIEAESPHPDFSSGEDLERKAGML